MTKMIGYLRCALIHPDELLRVEHQMRQCALAAGSPLPDSDLRREPAPQPNALWSLMQRMDHLHQSTLIGTLTTLADREKIDLSPFRGAPASSRVLWTAVSELESTGQGGYLVVPDMRHLEGLEVTRQQLMRRLGESRARIDVLDASKAEKVPAVANGDDHLIGEFRVAPVPLAEEIVRVNTRTRLARAGLADMIDTVDALMRELVGTVTEPDHLAGQDHSLTIFIHRSAVEPALVITCLDSRDFADTPPHPAVFAACPGRRVTRSAYGSGSATRCEVPLVGSIRQTGSPTPALARR